MAELEQCPFCGCNAEIILTSMGMRGKCLICEAVGPPREFSELAAEAWNTRALDERVRELREKVSQLKKDYPKAQLAMLGVEWEINEIFGKEQP